MTGRAPQDGKAGDWLYSIRSETAWLVPPGRRRRPFSHISVRQGKYSFLAGPDVRQTANKKAVRKLIENRLKALRRLAIARPSAETLPDPENDPIDPLRSFGTPEHRRKVEKAAEKAVIADYARRGFDDEDVTMKKRGYDYVFTKKGKEQLVEIKGTSGKEERFFMTRREFGFRQHPDWRLAMVTEALSTKPRLTIYSLKKFERRFGLEPLVYMGTARAEAL